MHFEGMLRRVSLYAANLHLRWRLHAFTILVVVCDQLEFCVDSEAILQSPGEGNNWVICGIYDGSCGWEKEHGDCVQALGESGTREPCDWDETGRHEVSAQGQGARPY